MPFRPGSPSVVLVFENVREDIHYANEWHRVPGVGNLLGPKAETLAAVLLAQELHVVMIYRFQAWCRSNRIPLVPLLCRRLTMLLGGVSIGDQVQIGPGLLINHGHVVIDGEVSIGRECSLAPFVTLGLNTGGPDVSFAGPRLGDKVFVGTGAKILGGVQIGDNARIGANAVVMIDVPAHHTAVGVPAHTIPHEFVLGPVVRKEDR